MNQLAHDVAPSKSTRPSRTSPRKRGRRGCAGLILGIGAAVASSPGIAFAAPSDAAGASSDSHAKGAKGETAAKGDGDKADAEKPKKDTAAKADAAK